MKMQPIKGFPKHSELLNKEVGLTTGDGVPSRSANQRLANEHGSSSSS